MDYNIFMCGIKDNKNKTLSVVVPRLPQGEFYIYPGGKKWIKEEGKLERDNGWIGVQYTLNNNVDKN